MSLPTVHSHISSFLPSPSLPTPSPTVTFVLMPSSSPSLYSRLLISITIMDKIVETNYHSPLSHFNVVNVAMLWNQSWVNCKPHETTLNRGKRGGGGKSSLTVC